MPAEDIRSLHESTSTGVPLTDALKLLRRSLFPFMYDPQPWVKGREETPDEIMKSIMAIYIFRMEIKKLKQHSEDPADFSKYLYQPEVDKGNNCCGATYCRK